MPNFISKDGILTPAKERVVIYDENHSPSIYEGPDRGAIEYMKEQGLDPDSDHLGMHFMDDSDIIERAHDKNKTIEEFTKQSVYTKEKRDKEFKERASKVVEHAPLKKTEYKGGKNTGTSLKGGFGETDSPLEDAKKSVKG